MDEPLAASLLLSREMPGGLARLDRASALHRIRAGAYVPRSEWEVLEPWRRYALRVQAVARTWTSPVFCLESAAVLQSLPVFGEPREIHLLSPDGKTWREGDVHVHGWNDARMLTTTGSLTLTAIEDTATDLCRVLPPAFGLAVADAALRSLGSAGIGLDLAARARSHANRRGLRQVDWVQARATAAAESPGESVSRAVIEWLGYDEPELQHEFHYEGVVDRSDFYWRSTRTIGESDGYGKYDADDPKTMKAQFVREKTREDRLRRYERGFARWDWADALRPASLDAKLRAAGLISSRLHQNAMLRTLASNPRSFAGRTQGNAANHRSKASGSR
ncbi:hypothetical protein ASD56_15365 [Microbacterium sp. Root166]|uniref:hypothetical protein n=1 Tax=Microbacterium sp. Root166 TaxID=1736478 RepID=UPI0006FA57EA|nr:hypothetical protein [Microbacterium sp. Root166]KQZ82247.1 hypothetical protein ASD56_15365 [Microbacterium sp. Root166]